MCNECHLVLDHITGFKRVRTDVMFYDSENRLHCLNGPAVICEDGYIAYFVHGKRHRDTGPARIWADGKAEWWMNGKRVRYGHV